MRNSVHLAMKIVQSGCKPTVVDAEILDAEIRFCPDILISDVVGKKKRVILKLQCITVHLINDKTR